jgi:radical SAM superfamily enzyme YgiQ (UPF0313 family)
LHINRAYEIADSFRKRGKTVVIGGYHATALPEEAKQHADSVVIGEAEYTWPQLLKDFKNSVLKPFYTSDRPVDKNDIPPGNRDQTKGTYFSASIQATRGCPNRCEFCTVTNSKFGAVLRERPIENVIDEIKTIPQKYLQFYDPSLTSHPEYTKSLFKEMRGLNKKFFCNGNVNILAKDEELLKLASEAGCTLWYVGFESFSQDNINQIGKKTNKINEYHSVVKNIRDYGMETHGFFIFGFDNDSSKVFEATLNAINDLELDAIGISILTPYPGTPFFDRLEKEGRINSKDWSRYNENEVIFKPKLMSEDELLRGAQWVEKKFYSLHNFSKMIYNKKDINLGLLFRMTKTHIIRYM